MYGGVMFIRNLLFDKEFLKQQKFQVPTIVIGNLNTGGTGKTPFTIYLAQALLQHNVKNIAILSRGYKRKSKGFFEVLVPDPLLYGDEPSEIMLNSPNAKTFVCESRPYGISQILKYYPETEVVILDDAFQHRSLVGGVNILLTAFNDPFYNDFMLPMGRLRESMKNKNRADFIICTKANEETIMNEGIARNKVYRGIQPLPGQQLYFTGIEYSKLRDIDMHIGPDLSRLGTKKILLVTSIANPEYLYNYIKEFVPDIDHLRFPDHHSFREKDMLKIVAHYGNNNDVVIITTGKDLVKLRQPENWIHLEDKALYFIPINVMWQQEEKLRFEQEIITYVTSN